MIMKAAMAAFFLSKLYIGWNKQHEVRLNMTATPILLIVTLMLLGSFLMLGLSSVTDIDSNYDLFFETNTLIIVIYVYAVARKAILPHKILHYGALLLIFNLCYDVATELEKLDQWADRSELIDTFLEDGLLQIAFLLIAIGITQLTSSIKAQAYIDELTGLFNRKKFDTVTLEQFDLIYLDLDGLKRVNDLKGHNVGDLMIVRFSQVLRQAAVQEELLFRIGGDEFVVIALKGRSADFIEQVVNLLHGENIDFSYGVTSGTRETLQQALVDSDKAMYGMKKSKQPESDS